MLLDIVASHAVVSSTREWVGAARLSLKVAMTRCYGRGHRGGDVLSRLRHHLQDLRTPTDLQSSSQPHSQPQSQSQSQSQSQPQPQAVDAVVVWSDSPGVAAALSTALREQHDADGHFTGAPMHAFVASLWDTIRVETTQWGSDGSSPQAVAHSPLPEESSGSGSDTGKSNAGTGDGDSGAGREGGLAGGHGSLDEIAQSPGQDSGRLLTSPGVGAGVAVFPEGWGRLEDSPASVLLLPLEALGLDAVAASLADMSAEVGLTVASAIFGASPEKPPLAVPLPAPHSPSATHGKGEDARHVAALFRTPSTEASPRERAPESSSVSSPAQGVGARALPVDVHWAVLPPSALADGASLLWTSTPTAASPSTTSSSPLPPSRMTSAASDSDVAPPVGSALLHRCPHQPSGGSRFRVFDASPPGRIGVCVQRSGIAPIADTESTSDGVGGSAAVSRSSVVWLDALRSGGTGAVRLLIQAAAPPLSSSSSSSSSTSSSSSLLPSTVEFQVHLCDPADHPGRRPGSSSGSTMFCGNDDDADVFGVVPRASRRGADVSEPLLVPLGSCRLQMTRAVRSDCKDGAGGRYEKLACEHEYEYSVLVVEGCEDTGDEEDSDALFDDLKPDQGPSSRYLSVLCSVAVDPDVMFDPHAASASDDAVSGNARGGVDVCIDVTHGVLAVSLLQSVSASVTATATTMTATTTATAASKIASQRQQRSPLRRRWPHPEWLDLLHVAARLLVKLTLYAVMALAAVAVSATVAYLLLLQPLLLPSILRCAPTVPAPPPLVLRDHGGVLPEPPRLPHRTHQYRLSLDALLPPPQLPPAPSRSQNDTSNASAGMVESDAPAPPPAPVSVTVTNNAYAPPTLEAGQGQGQDQGQDPALAFACDVRFLARRKISRTSSASLTFPPPSTPRPRTPSPRTSPLQGLVRVLAQGKDLAQRLVANVPRRLKNYERI